MWQTLKNFILPLKDLLLCKWYRFKKILDYPNTILPSPKYKLEIPFDNLLEDHPVYLVRRSLFSKEETFTTVGTVSDKALAPDDVPDLSMNLLGGFYLLDYIKYRITGQASKKWEGQKIFLSKYVHHIQKLSEFSPIIYNARSLHNKEIPFTYNDDKASKKYVQEWKELTSKEHQKLQKGTEIQGKMLISHDPSNLNYWHVVLKVIAPKNEEVKKYSGPRRSAIDYIVEHYLSIGTSELPGNLEIINSSCYYKN